MNPVFGYIRVSSLGQVEGDGFPRQLDAIKKFARSKRLKIVEVYKDEGVSGTECGFDRPGLSDMMIALKSNGVRIVLVSDASRLARDLMIQEVILADFRKHGITCFESSGSELTVSDGDPTRILIRQVLGAVSQFEKSNLVQKLAAARKRIRRTSGKCEGGPSYVQIKHPAIERIMELRKQKLTLKDIAEKLNGEGIKPMRGEKWFAMQICRIVKQ